MKIVVLLVLAVGSLFSFTFKKEAAARYKDLNTGMAFNLVQDPNTGLMVDVETGKPLNIYVDTKTGDTIYGRTGKIINGNVVKVNNYEYAYGNATNSNASIAVAP